MPLMLFPVHALNSVAQLNAWLVAGGQGNYDAWSYGSTMPAWKRWLEELVDGSYLVMSAAGARDIRDVDVHPNAAGYRLIADVVLERPKAYADDYGVRAWD
jgi:hypothetical protein